MADSILFYQPEATPLLTLTAKLRGKREAFNYRFEWLEKDEFPRTLTVTAAALDTDTSVSVTAGEEARVAANYVVENKNTGELFSVGATSSGTLSSLVRGIGGGAAAMSVGDTLVVLGPVYEDGASAGSPRSIQEFNLFNYTQIIRTPFGFTGRDRATELYGGRDETVETKWQSIEHKKSIEYFMFFGKRHLITSGTHYRSFTGGLEYFINSNVWNVSGVTLNERAFVEFLEQGLKWGKGGNQNGSGQKFLLCSSRWLTEINGWVHDRLQYRVLDKQIGFSAMEYVSPHGSVMLMRAPLLDYYHPDYAFLIDRNHLKYVNHRDRDTKLRLDIQANDVDGRENEYLTDVGLEVSFEHSHALLKGLSV
jgi:hypothetical protein